MTRITSFAFGFKGRDLQLNSPTLSATSGDDLYDYISSDLIHGVEN